MGNPERVGNPEPTYGLLALSPVGLPIHGPSGLLFLNAHISIRGAGGRDTPLSIRNFSFQSQLTAFYTRYLRQVGPGKQKFTIEKKNSQ